MDDDASDSQGDAAADQPLLCIVHNRQGYWLCATKWQYDNWKRKHLLPDSAFAGVVYLGPGSASREEILAAAFRAKGFGDDHADAVLAGEATVEAVTDSGRRFVAGLDVPGYGDNN